MPDEPVIKAATSFITAIRALAKSAPTTASMKKFLHLWNDSSVRIIAENSNAGNGDALKSSASLSRNYLNSTPSLLRGVRTNSISLEEFLCLDDDINSFPRVFEDVSSNLCSLSFRKVLMGVGDLKGKRITGRIMVRVAKPACGMVCLCVVPTSTVRLVFLIATL